MCELAAVSHGAFAASAVLSSQRTASVPLLRCPSLGTQFSQAAVACAIFRCGRNSSFQAGLSWKRMFLLVLSLRWKKIGSKQKNRSVKIYSTPVFSFSFFCRLPHWTAYKNFYFTKTKNLKSSEQPHYEHFQHTGKKSRGKKMKRSPHHVLSKHFIKYLVNKPATLWCLRVCKVHNFSHFKSYKTICVIFAMGLSERKLAEMFYIFKM